MVIKKEKIDDNLVVITYLQLGSMLNAVSNEQITSLVRYIEDYYIDEADNELGEFLDEMVKIYLTLLNNDELHMYIRECIYESELNLEMLYYVGLQLQEIIKQQIINPINQQKILV